MESLTYENMKNIIKWSMHDIFRAQIKLEGLISQIIMIIEQLVYATDVFLQNWILFCTPTPPII